MEEEQTTLSAQIQAVQVHVEQLGAELKDPETSEERKKAIKVELRSWWNFVQALNSDG
jgi:hypothetical protein